MGPPGQPEKSPLRQRVVRYDELIPCRSAFIDTRTPGSTDKENFTIIGPGVAENPDQYVHIDIPHGFNIGGARQPPGCVNSQHSHETAEVFVVHSGRWSFALGESGDDGSIELGPGDTISIPTNVFRGFTNTGDDMGFLFAILGGDDPGHVMWAPSVFEDASQHGLVLLRSGRLIDTTRGETVPAGEAIMPPTTAEDVARVNRMTAGEIARCVVRSADLDLAASHPFPDDPTITETSIIGRTEGHYGVEKARLTWPHGFSLRRLSLMPGSETPSFAREEAEVLMMYRGELEIRTATETLRVSRGDVFTAPVGLSRVYANAGAEPAVVYVVHGSDQPTPWAQLAP